MSAFLNLIALISLITSIVFFVKGFKNKPKFKKAALFFCATWVLWFVSAMIDPEPTKVNGKQEDKQEAKQETETKKEEKAKQEEAKKQQEAEEKKKQEEAKKQQEVEEKEKQEEAKKQQEVEEKKKQEEAKKQQEVEEKEKEKEEETQKEQEAEQAKDSGLNEVQAQEKAEQLKLAQGQGARNKDVKLSQLGVQTIKDGIQYTTPVQDIHIEAKDSLTRIVAIMPVGTTKEQAKEVGDSLARQVASFGTMGLYVDLHSPSKDYLGEYWENFSGDIGIFDSNEKQLARGYIDKLNPTKIKW
ncbi:MULTISPECIES: multimodular transpeptidase-transglycosylase / penicillin-binding protein 1A/1B [Bacillus cereus group]|uniref:multimodular transpeptidase-transglycosylase / penicillin-binding protein 1A/1B n=1 Tax=Bacillus cereus group TaxID=86661 RepID=UPI0007FB3B3B|nr:MULTISPECIES: multimodular transpeptidase-transglycosylase / penicillin-binding protein 1A/1B [Bacillus cereus group]MCP1399289.1 outer membrane biosynthesis protein TonB [Bacillus cereus]OBW84851.1 multimodular transpeptidase-transglycosylase / penicillin-binding protein 1A/1B [Bacillus cereus]PEV60860.1 multimodular transpeptidase-transglycosylase / penicillin-binding protein 1A/1B [Bacillus thuringiensis]PFC41771.1 multimodular transpeptidase-transglycosylase / penicillin-binding protein 